MTPTRNRFSFLPRTPLIRAVFLPLPPAAGRLICQYICATQLISARHTVPLVTDASPLSPGARGTIVAIPPMCDRVPESVLGT
ncbi:hypothetical protein C2E23DRAFT_150769 [Lenzites betulinus]|nr:hypothetical protein C2E23DRAFT_150769 [Lenzites betulinus]